MLYLRCACCFQVQSKVWYFILFMLPPCLQLGGELFELKPEFILLCQLSAPLLTVCAQCASTVSPQPASTGGLWATEYYVTVSAWPWGAGWAPHCVIDYGLNTHHEAKGAACFAG